MRHFRWILLVALIACLAPGVRGDIEPATETANRYDTASAVTYSFETQTTAAVGADTASIAVRLPELSYLDLTSGPAWRVLLGVRTSAAGSADTVKVEFWHGNDADHTLYRSHTLADTTVVCGVPRAFDITTVPVSNMRWFTLYLTNDDSTAAVFDVDLSFVKGSK